jgi:probable rRNA maturation factor
VEQAERQAREHGVSFEEELVRLCIHGTLHVLGYDHGAQEEEEGTAESAMFRKQEALVREVMAGARVAGSASRSRRPEI